MSNKKSNHLGAGRVVLRVFIIILETVLLLAGTVFTICNVAFNGPSEAFRKIAVLTAKETSALKWVPGVFLSEDVVDEIVNSRDDSNLEATDASLVTITSVPSASPAPTASSEDTEVETENTAEVSEGPQADAWGLVDDDGDGIILVPIKGEGFVGTLMVVLDPSRVILGTIPESYYKRGYTVAEMVEEFDAVAGINAGGFYDPNGQGNGSIPDTLVVNEGVIYEASRGVGGGFVGIDDNYILHVGKLSQDEIEAANIQYGVCFGPVLISNGVMADESSLSSGLNPRTAIGQRSDGAILMLVIDGRQAISIGATYTDVAEIMMKYGAVNAINLDGGSSTLMWYDGDYINNCASVVGIRPVPTAFLVTKEGKSDVGQG